MRLTCPSCGATYEIDVSLVPPGGRDVQCSNCGGTWFQEAPARQAEAVAADTAQDQAADIPAPPVTDRRRRPDEAVLDVLRQEREHEARARASEGAAAPQPDAVPADPEANASRERARVAAAAALARSRNAGAPGATTEAVTAPEIEAETMDAVSRALSDADSGPVLDDHPRDQGQSDSVVDRRDASRRNLLPDIEEINSSLRPDERAAEQAASNAGVLISDEDVAARSNGFRIGFSVVVLIVLAFLLLYIFAEPLGEAVPALAGFLDSYREWADGQRAALDGGADSLADWLTSSAGE